MEKIRGTRIAFPLYFGKKTSFGMGAKSKMWLSDKVEIEGVATIF